MPKEWLVPAPNHQADQLAVLWGVPPLVAHLLLNRGLSEASDYSGFLAPQLRDLHAPSLLPGVPRAATLLAEAVRGGKHVVVYGDYDVDGITGVAILWHVLTRLGAKVSFYVPHRIEEGYGLNVEAVSRLIQAERAEILVSVDCGITAVDSAEAARAAGVPLIITDHHAPHARLPDAEVIVHPTVGGAYANPHLCGAGVAFKLAWALAQEICGADRVRSDLRDLLVEMLALAALGTIADVVPLVGENRIIARHGLRVLPKSVLPGVRALIEVAGLTGEKINDYDVGFKLAPRLNAAGRMGHARLAVELLTRADEARGREIAMYLEEHNRARQATERRIARQALETVDRDNLAGDARRAIVLAGEGWHPGVVGIVAARVVERYHRPAVLIALSNGEGQGSARSIAPFDLAAALERCGEHLISFGGHAMAAGLRVSPDRVPAFTEAFVDVANQRLTGADLRPRLRLDAEVSLADLTIATTERVLSLGPFGVGNPRPRLATGWVELADEPRCVGRQSEHLQASFVEGGTRIRAIGFGLGGQIEDLKQQRRCRVAFEPIINEFNGRRTVEMQMLDMQFDGSE